MAICLYICSREFFSLVLDWLNFLSWKSSWAKDLTSLIPWMEFSASTFTSAMVFLTALLRSFSLCPNTMP